MNSNMNPTAQKIGNTTAVVADKVIVTSQVVAHDTKGFLKGAVKGLTKAWREKSGETSIHPPFNTIEDAVKFQAQQKEHFQKMLLSKDAEITRLKDQIATLQKGQQRKAS